MMISRSITHSIVPLLKDCEFACRQLSTEYLLERGDIRFVNDSNSLILPLVLMSNMNSPRLRTSYVSSKQAENESDFVVVERSCAFHCSSFLSNGCFPIK